MTNLTITKKNLKVLVNHKLNIGNVTTANVALRVCYYCNDQNFYFNIVGRA